MVVEKNVVVRALVKYDSGNEGYEAGNIRRYIHR